ncbi:hypothetical protein DL96DRAFT_1823695 [Flagelloscypha sp. PMI_526]|nr:hypothetical protein DL96DRAFT_1823695 [Flagelloscypha sp. PMI_526]
MSTLAFPRFLDLPAEIQGMIWHLTASSLASQSEQAKLLVISRSSSAWIQDILYHTVYGYPARFRRLNSSIVANDKVFRIKTKRLLLKNISGGRVSDLPAIIPSFQALQRANVWPHGRPFLVLKNLLALPNLMELHMCNHYAEITSKELASLEGSPSLKTITRVCYYHGEIDPPSGLFRYFPTMLYMIIRGHRQCSRSELQNWLKDAQQSLRVFALMDTWSRRNKEEVEDMSIVAKQFGKKFSVIRVSERGILSKYWDIMDHAWDGMRRIEAGETLVKIKA